MSDGEQPSEGGVLAPPPPAGLRPLGEPPTFSVVIAAYQAAATVGDAVASVLAQTHPAHEVIVVDDGSTDGLSAALGRFGDEVALLRKANGGPASARNAGIAAAGGEFLASLDADDRFHPGRLGALARVAMLRPDLDLIGTDARFLVDGEEVGTFLVANPFPTEEQRGAILRNCFVGGLPAARMSRLREVGGFDEELRQGEDWDCWLRLILSGSAAGMVARPLYDYVLRRGSLTSSRVESLQARVRLLEKARGNPDLRESEQSLLRRELRRRHSEAVREEVLGEDRPGRSRLLGLAAAHDLESRTRALAALAALAPGPVRRLAHGRGSPVRRLGREDR